MIGDVNGVFSSLFPLLNHNHDHFLVLFCISTIIYAPSTSNIHALCMLGFICESCTVFRMQRRQVKVKWALLGRDGCEKCYIFGVVHTGSAAFNMPPACPYDLMYMSEVSQNQSPMAPFYGGGDRFRSPYDAT